MQIAFLLIAVLAGWSQDQPAIPEKLVSEATGVKVRHEKALFKLPAVVGVGVAASEQHPGKAAIRIYVSRKLTARERNRFPAELDGVPVEIRESGAIRALPKSKGKKRP